MPVCGKLNDAGTMTSVNRPGSVVAGAEPVEQRPARLHEARQHDEQIAGDERGDERVARSLRMSRARIGRQRGDQSREHPQADEQGHGDVGDKVDLQAAQLLQTQRAGRVGGDRKQPVRRETRHEARGRRRSRLSRRAGRRAAVPCAATPTSATPRMSEKRTTAGTTLFASELNGFDGMYRSTKSNARAARPGSS